MAQDEAFVAMDIGRARVRFSLQGVPNRLSVEQVTAWVEGCCRAVGRWYGHFPGHPVEVVLRVVPGRGVRGGVTYSGSLPRVQANLGTDSTLGDLEGNWVLVHELVHLACPDLPSANHWLEEGLATYIEPWIRLEHGQVSAEKAWFDLVDGMPQGQPGPADRGLDITDTWGRTYWGGAIFCLLADLALLRLGKPGLQGVWSALLAKPGQGIQRHSDMASLMAQLDQLAAAPVFDKLWKAHSHTPISVDLEAIWSDLGVVRAGGTVTFDDKAPHAAWRRAIDGTTTAKN
jgi:hypothetical protein